MSKPNKPTKETYERNARIFKLMANAKRLEILGLLNESKEMTVTEMVNVMGIRKANVSQHLAILRYIKLVNVRRSGKNAFYSLSDPRIIEPSRIMDDIWHKNPSLNI